MTEKPEQSPVVTKYEDGLWVSSFENEPLPGGAFRRRSDAEKVGEAYAKKRGLIHKVYSPIGELVKESNHQESNKDEGTSTLISGLGDILFAALGALFR